MLRFLYNEIRFSMQPAKLTPRFSDALVYAAALHADQRRKGTETPYMAHLLGVTALVLEDGGDEDEAIAALLHDAVEDQGGLRVLDEIRSRYGEKVASIVLGCSDSTSNPKPPWRARKEAYLQHLRSANRSELRVALADKLYNALSLVVDLNRSGESVWDRFAGKKEGTLWYYQALSEVFAEVYPGALTAEMVGLVNRLRNG